jgi:hypothetical protein
MSSDRKGIRSSPASIFLARCCTASQCEGGDPFRRKPSQVTTRRRRGVTYRSAQLTYRPRSSLIPIRRRSARAASDSHGIKPATRSWKRRRRGLSGLITFGQGRDIARIGGHWDQPFKGARLRASGLPSPFVRPERFAACRGQHLFFGGAGGRYVLTLSRETPVRSHP